MALLALYPSAHWPWVAGLTGLLCLTVFVSGPISVLVPAMLEPMLMVAGRAYPPLLVALVAVAGNLYMDYINYHVFGAAIHHPRLEKAKNSRIVQGALMLFQRSPFFAVWLCSWSPIPYWIVSTLAPLCGNTCWPRSWVADRGSGFSLRWGSSSPCRPKCSSRTWPARSPRE